MIIKFLKLMLVSIACCISAFGQSPKETVEQLQKLCVDGRTADARKLISKFPNLHPLIAKLANDTTDRVIADLQTGDTSYTAIDQKVNGDCAAVFIKEEHRGRESEDYDPIYLVKQDDRWTILPKPSDWKIAAEAMGNRKIFEELEGWFEEQKAGIKAADE